MFSLTFSVIVLYKSIQLVSSSGHLQSELLCWLAGRQPTNLSYATNICKPEQQLTERRPAAKAATPVLLVMLG